jgi:hypothetical protein
MAYHKAMGLGTMFVLLVVCVALLPMLVRYIDTIDVHYNISGFENSIPQVSTDSTMRGKNVTIERDSNTNYMCNSPNGNGESCPEGTFCDGTTQSCVSIYPRGGGEVVGYYA